MIPAPASKDFMEKSTPIFTTHSIPSIEMEEWVKLIREKSEQNVDWHFFGGHAIVRAIGDLNKVRLSIIELLEKHDFLQKKAYDEYACEWQRDCKFL